jgi:hypothetical protein
LLKVSPGPSGGLDSNAKDIELSSFINLIAGAMYIIFVSMSIICYLLFCAAESAEFLSLRMLCALCGK